MKITEALKLLQAEQRGDYYICLCPACNHKEAFIYHSDIERYQKNFKHKIPIRCNRQNKCGTTSYLNDIATLDRKYEYIPPINYEEVIGISEYGKNRINNLVHLGTDIDFEWRGISNITLKANGVIYLKDGLISFMKAAGKEHFNNRFYSYSYENRTLIFPIKDYEGNVERLLLRGRISENNPNYKKEIIMKIRQKTNEIWNKTDFFTDYQPIFITEGVVDGLSIKEISQTLGVIAIPGVAKYRQIVNEIERIGNQARKKHYVICFDNDEAGQKYGKKFGEELGNRDISYSYLVLPDHIKDINDWLGEDRKGLTQAILQEVQKVEKKLGEKGLVKRITLRKNVKKGV